MGVSGNLSNIMIGLVGLSIVIVVVILIMSDFLSVLPFINAQDSANLESGSTSLSAAIPFLIIIAAVAVVGALFRS